MPKIKTNSDKKLIEVYHPKQWPVSRRVISSFRKSFAKKVNLKNLCTGMVLGFPGYCRQRHNSFPRTMRWTLLCWLYWDKCIKGLKAPNCSKRWLLHEFLYCLSWVWAWERERERVWVPWSHDATEYRQSIGLESTRALRTVIIVSL